MIAVLVPANHSSGHWAVDFLLFLAPAIALAALLWIWQRRDRTREEGRDDSERPDCR